MEYGYFTADNMPSEPCDVHVLVKYDGREKGIDLGYCPREDMVYVALIKADRKFPLELTVTDAEFVYKDLNNYSSIPSEDLPYFYYSQDGGYSGISDRKKHFNRACPKHR